MPPLSEEIAEKSVAAALSAIEVYNKPDFRYREETFAILMTNAWEILLKAKFIKDNNEDQSSVTEYENVANPADGTITKQPKLNRSGNTITFGLRYLLDKLYQQTNSGLSKPCCDNIHLLIEVRDNSVHFINKDLYFARRIQEIGTASLRNYLSIVAEWFGLDLSRYNFFLMPLSFYHGFEIMQPASLDSYTDQMKNLLCYLASVESASDVEEGAKHYVTLSIETSFVRSKDAGALPFRLTDDPTAPVINIREEDVLKSHPYDYNSLTQKLRLRYANFVVNQSYHEIRKPLEADPKFCKIRLLDPNSPRSARKKYYSSEVFKEFDQHYRKK